MGSCYFLYFDNLYQIFTASIGISYLIGGYCDNFKFNNDSRITDNGNANTYLSDNQMALRAGNDSARDRIYVRTTTSSTASDFKIWLRTHNTTVYYVLATPTNEAITDTTLINQLNLIEKAYAYSQTNVSQTNDNKPFIISAETIRSLVDVFD